MPQDIDHIGAQVAQQAAHEAELEQARKDAGHILRQYESVTDGRRVPRFFGLLKFLSAQLDLARTELEILRENVGREQGECQDFHCNREDLLSLERLYARALNRVAELEATLTATLPTDSAARKCIPLARGLADYFPSALAAVAELSYWGNEKHNPGEPLHHARAKSGDHADCILRHLFDRGTTYVEMVQGAPVTLRHSAALAWRALALLQEELEAEGAPLPRGAK